jgi:hypothetical protein
MPTPEPELEFKCPHCGEDLKNNLMLVQDGCTNYIYYTQDDKGNWNIDDELDGAETSEVYFACRLCGERLPRNLQEYFEDNIDK